MQRYHFFSVIFYFSCDITLNSYIIDLILTGLSWQKIRVSPVTSVIHGLIGQLSGKCFKFPQIMLHICDAQLWSAW